MGGGDGNSAQVEADQAVAQQQRLAAEKAAAIARLNQIFGYGTGAATAAPNRSDFMRTSTSRGAPATAAPGVATVGAVACDG